MVFGTSQNRCLLGHGQRVRVLCFVPLECLGKEACGLLREVWGRGFKKFFRKLKTSRVQPLETHVFVHTIDRQKRLDVYRGV